MNFEKSGVYFPKNQREIKLSGGQVNELLLTVAADLHHSSGNLVKSPAAITDAKGRLLCLALSKDPGLEFESPTALALRAISQQLGVPELVGKELSIHVLRDLDGQIDALGDIYNFGPGRVVIGSQSPDLAQVIGELSNDEYWKEAALRRNMSKETLPPNDKKPQPGRFPVSDFEKSHLSTYRIVPSSFSSLVFEKWRNIRVDSANHEQIKELMNDLHHLAAQNVSELGGPFAAAVISSDGKVMGVGENQVVRSSDPSAHGERVAMWSAINQIEQDRKGTLSLKDCTVVTSSFPCIGCAEACARAGISEIIYGNPRETVQEMTPFSEGPLDNGKLEKLKIILRRVEVEEQVAHTGFQEFKKVVGIDPKKSYLTDLGRN